MGVLLYTTNGGGDAFDRLMKRIEGVVPTAGIRIGHRIEDLCSELRRPMSGYKIVVLVAEDPRALEAYVSIRDLLKDLSIILVLPNFHKHTLLQACRLYPRFTSDTEGDFKDVAAVLAQMLKRMHS